MPFKFYSYRKQNEVIKNTLKSLAQGAKADFETTVQTWDNKPEFKVESGDNYAEVYTDDEVYSYLNYGTEPHPIVAVNVKNLVFNRDTFMPKTRVGFIGSNKGQKATKNKFVGKAVNHPGNEAREWDEVIKKKWMDKVEEIFKKQWESTFGR